MLTPQEVSGRAFSKAAFGGYNMAMVDEFLDELTDDYTSLYKENAALKAKLKVLVDKVEEYRATEDSMRAALLTAQRMANTMVEEAEEKKKAMLVGAEDEARAKIGALQSDVELEQRRLNAAKAATAEFLQKTRELAQAQLALIERAPDLTPEEIAAAETATASTESIQRETGEDGFTLELVLGDYGAEDKLVEYVALRAAIETLPERERQVIALRFYHGMTQQNCAKVMHVSQVQISRLERRAVELLREKLE